MIARNLPGVVVGLALSVCAGTASAYVRSRAADSCQPIYWQQSCVYLQPDSGFVPDMSGADVERILQKSMSNWTSRTTGSYFKLHYLPPSGPLNVTYKDHLSVVIFRTGTKFCRPATDSAAQVCYDPSAAAVTTVSYINKKGDPSDGVIVDADIEMNAVNNQFVEIGKTLPASDGRNQTDLENTLTHELGHLLGLDHTCRLSADPACLTDDQGQPRQLCDVIEKGRLINPTYQALYVTSMFAVAPQKDIEKRTPKADDLAGIAAISPLSKDPNVCELPGSKTDAGCSCQVGHRQPSSLASLLAVGLAGLAIFRRRRQHSCADSQAIPKRFLSDS